MYAGLSVAEIMSEKKAIAAVLRWWTQMALMKLQTSMWIYLWKLHVGQTSAERILRSAKGRKSNDSIHMFS